MPFMGKSYDEPCASEKGRRSRSRVNSRRPGALTGMVAKTRKAPWKKKNPRKAAGRKSVRLTAEQKDAARARAKRAGRRYPNLVDNMWAAQRGKPSHRGRAV